MFSKISSWSPLSQRLAMSALAIAVITSAIAFSFHPIFRYFLPILIIFLAVAALKEYYQLAVAKGFKPLEPLGSIAAAAYISAAFLSAAVVVGPVWGLLPAGVAWTALAVCFAYYFVRGSNPVVNIAVTAFGFLYIVVPLGFGLSINYLFPEGSGQDGRWWLLYLLVVAKSSDVAAYAVGKGIGKLPLCPYLSPKKTWEGAFAGFFAAIVASELFALCSMGLCPAGLLILTPLYALLLGALLGVLAAFGDLAESLLKRDSGIKDSSHLPGLGGMLDIVDSLLFTAPALYLVLRIFTEWRQ